jgi:serine protease Do
VTDRIAYDPKTELVLLTVDPKAAPLQEAEWGDSDALQVGDWVVSVGRARDRSRIISAGIVSGPGPETESDSMPQGTLVTDAVTAGASAGGPLVNLEGKVVGINQAGGEPLRRFEPLGHALPSKQARRIAGELVEHGRVRRGYLGVVIGPAGLGSLGPRSRSTGLVVNGVTPGSPAAQAGLRVGDLILAVDSKPFAYVEALSRMVEDAPVGREFAITLERDGVRREVKVQTRARPEISAGAVDPLAPAPLGPIRRFRPRNRAFGPVERPSPRRGPDVLKSEPKTAEPDSKPNDDRKKARKREQAPQASPDGKPDLPPALAPSRSGPPLDKPAATSL